MRQLVETRIVDSNAVLKMAKIFQISSQSGTYGAEFPRKRAMETSPLPLKTHFRGQFRPPGNVGFMTERLTRTDAFPYPNIRPKNASRAVCSVYVARMLIVVIAQCEEFSV